MADSLIKNRLSELARRSFERGIWTFSEFLTLAEQDELLRLRLPAPVSLEGGYEAAERRLAAFGSEESCGWSEKAPIACLKISPVNAKFADTLTHRDFLGSLMGLGIRREVLGDIVVTGNEAWLFALDTIAGYITENLTQVKRTTVTVRLSEPPEALSEPPEVTELVVASERLDAVLAAVWRMSRTETQEHIAAGRVFISGRLSQSADARIPEGAIVSLRGAGRFMYEGTLRETKKGRLRVAVRIYR